MTHKKKLAPSIMCAKLDSLTETLCLFKDCGVELLHMDIMDGEFVPNLMLGTDFCRQLKVLSDIPFDYHFMVGNINEKLRWFPIGEGDFVSFHLEAVGGEDETRSVLRFIRDKGARPMLALSPDTPLSAAEAFLREVDGLLIMTAKPGFAGQKLVPEALEKIRRARDRLDSIGLERVEIEVDGNVSVENAALMSSSGANIFVAGSSSVFKSPALQENIAALRNAVAGR